MNLAEHPTVRRFHENAGTRPAPPSVLDAAWLRQLCLDCGADDAGLVEISRPALDNQRDDILRSFPPAKTLLSFVCRMNREPIRSPARSVANLEFHHTGDHVNEVARKVVATLERQGVRALNPAMGFPMEMDRFPGGKIWVVSHKPVAVAAGLGHMGIHRNVIHPRFGNFILLGTVLIAAEATAYDQPISYNPCLECKLCVAACPGGSHRPERRLQLLGLLHAQLPGVHGRLHRLGRADRRQQERPGLPQEGVRPGIGVDVAKPLVRGQLQGGVLPERLPGWGRGHRPLSHRQGRASTGGRSSVAGEGGDGLRRRRLGRRGACGPPLPPQDDQTSRQRPAAPDDPAVLVGAASHVSAGEGGEVERRLPLHVHRQGREAGDRRRSGTAPCRSRTVIRARPTCV